MVKSGLEDKFNKIIKLTLDIEANDISVQDPSFKLALPKSLEYLSLRFEASYSAAVIPVHQCMAKIVAENKTISTLKLDKIVMYCIEIETAWKDAMIANASVRNLSLSNFANNYSCGDKFLMALK